MKRKPRPKTNTRLWSRYFRWRMITGQEHCRICNTHEDLTFGHLCANALGGKFTPANLTILCAPCNNAMGQSYIDGLETIQELMTEEVKQAMYDWGGVNSDLSKLRQSIAHSVREQNLVPIWSTETRINKDLV